ncbi:hypothetical protein [Planotetraspora kaengkrachanensis]|uniref:Uncharacterized protein n=1 Tax=Planotetraspora kaengkrachanensis TaxID=575193 RepID=A0A8J3PU51_9ACTN|nr:hypothetical protein [Planotetraspora kaengkrachanensis]GIG81092.1 hypothetical protein Pka01_42190 [Planotetraspora kaengkrachanensis]
MICQRYGRAFGRKTAAAYVVAGVSASAVFIGATAPFPAIAAAKDPRPAQKTQDPGPEVMSAKSANELNGRQNTSTTTTSGATSVQNALCRNARICNITQKVVVIAPTPTPMPTPTVIPEPVVTPEPVVVLEPEPAPVLAPEPVEPSVLSLGLFLYLYGGTW